jgi:hypothetical protein
LITERQVRTPYLENVKFLGSYRMRSVNDAHQAQLLRILSDLKETDPVNLLALISPDRWRQAQLLPTLWQLVASRQVGADLEQPLTMRSRIWLKESR